MLNFSCQNNFDIVEILRAFVWQIRQNIEFSFCNMLTLSTSLSKNSVHGASSIAIQIQRNLMFECFKSISHGAHKFMCLSNFLRGLSGQHWNQRTCYFFEFIVLKWIDMLKRLHGNNFERPPLKLTNLL